MESSPNSQDILAQTGKHGKDFFKTLPEELLLKIMGQKNLSLKERVRLMAVCKAWSTLGWENWVSLELDDVPAHQMPVILKFINRLGMHNAETLKHISFPYTASSPARIPAYLDYQRFIALESLDFGITNADLPGKTSGDGPTCWALCSQEIQSLSYLKNLKSLRATSMEDQNAQVVTLEAFSGLLQLTELTLKLEPKERIRLRRFWPDVELSQRLADLVHLRRLELYRCSVVINNIFEQQALTLTHVAVTIVDSANKALLVPNLISASLSERDLFLPLQDTHKLQSLTLYGHLRELPNYSLLPALTHLKWDDLYGPRTQTIEGIEPLAAASRLKSLELECYTPSEYGKISEFHRFCPRLEALQINNLVGTNFTTGLFGSACMQFLRKLTLQFDLEENRFTDVFFALKEEHVPSLTYLEVSPCFFTQHLEHSKLQTLKISSEQFNEDTPAVLLGNLPALKCLRLNLRIEKIQDVVALASSLPKMPNVEDVYVRNCSEKYTPELSIALPVFWASRDWCKIEKLELVESKAKIVVPRDSIQRLKHFGIVCQRLSIPQSCFPLPLKSLCFQADTISNMTTTHLTGSGVVVQQRGLDVAYDIVRDVQPPQVQVMQAYSHDFNLPDKDWLPQSKELVSVMKERLSHV